MKVIVGLGNPGKKYEQTRHNIGFLFVDWLANVVFGLNDSDFKEDKKFKAMVAETSFSGEKFLLVKPLTFMNLSGETVVAIKNFYKLQNEDFVIAYDDIDLEFGVNRYREKGSAGTHNGMRSIVGLVGAQDVPRLRLGVDSDERLVFGSLADFVLARFKKDEWDQLVEFFEQSWAVLKGKIG